MFWTIIGSAAATLTMFSFVPQIIKAAKTKSVKDVSLITLLQFLVGVLLWTLYGMHLKDRIIILANVVSLANLIILLWLYFKYTRDDKIWKKSN
jgi:MtN3 and saliva related transmembrane protein